MAILEGMACGKAIISTTVGAIPEVVKEENGILIEPGDTEKLSEALITYCMNQETVEKIGKIILRLFIQSTAWTRCIKK